MLRSMNRGRYLPRRPLVIRRLRCPALGLFATAVIVATIAIIAHNRHFVVNLSPSLPYGLYRRIADEPARGRLVEFRLPIEPPSRARTPVQLVLKPIIAGQGDYVDTSGDSLWINGRPVAPIHRTDSAGRALPVWRASRRLEEDEFFTYSARVPNSFDSRYYGPVRRRDILAVYVPLWTLGEPVKQDDASRLTASSRTEP